jgi:hypothetical protein
MVGAALASLVLVMGGCHGCKPRWSVAGWLANKRATWNRPRCESDADCRGRLSCPAHLMASCVVHATGWEDDRAYCWCEDFQWVPNPDGGAGHVMIRCAPDPDGGAPICGRWDDAKQIIVGEDGQAIGNQDGGIL